MPMLRNRAILSLAVLSFSPLCVRLALVLRMNSIGWGDLRGGVSDLLLASVAGLVLSFIPTRAYRAMLITLHLLVTLISAIEYEHVLALRTSFDISEYAQLWDSTFFFSSVLGTTAPWLLGTTLVIPCMALWSRASRAFEKRNAWLSIGIFLLLACVEGLWPPRIEIPRWRQQNVLIENANRALGNPIRPRRIQAQLQPFTTPGSTEVYDRPDLSGTSRLPREPRARNVLLITLEGASGRFVFRPGGQIRDPHEIDMPQLRRFAKHGFGFSHFLAPQHQTHRGQYALLCGTLPNLTVRTDRIDLIRAFEEKTGHHCLPFLLAQNGLQTAYVQASTLEYRNTETFLKAIRFERTLGRRWFEGNIAVGRWGVGDRDLFQQSLPVIDELSANPKPWFLNLETIGTHHPFVLPRSEIGRTPWGRRGDAFRYLDQALAEFLHDLEKRHLLRDTLVLITSDESHGSLTSDSLLDQNWVPLIAVGPGIPSEEISETFLQSDIQVSILDYLNFTIDEQSSGRSVFRHYAKERPIFLANGRKNHVSVMHTDRVLTSCTRDLRDCGEQRFEDSQFLWHDLVLSEKPDPARVEFLRSFISGHDQEEAMAKAAIPPCPKPMLWAHRGLHTSEAPNSIAGFIAAAKAGFCGIELDIHWFDRHGFVVSHRKPTETQIVSGEKPTLKAVFRALRAYPVYFWLDFKNLSDQNSRQAADRLRLLSIRFDFSDRVFVEGRHWGALVALEKRFPGIRPVFWVNTPARAMSSRLDDLGAELTNPSSSAISAPRKLVERFIDPGKLETPLFSWNYQTPEAVRDGQKRGIRVLLTDQDFSGEFPELFCSPAEARPPRKICGF